MDRKTINWEAVNGWFSHKNYEVFKNLNLPKKAVILESGTCWGRSACALGTLYPDAEIHTCDPTNYGAILPENATYHKCKTIDLKWDKPIDLLFIDNSHLMADIKEDFEKYEPFVKEGGYICFHDYCRDRLDVEDVRTFVRSLPQDKITIQEGEFGMAIYKK